MPRKAHIKATQSVKVKKIDPPVSLTAATLSSGNRHPFVCFADIFCSANWHTLVTS